MPANPASPVHELEQGTLEPGLALCLSGGGYRAMLFHAGALWRLNEAGLLGSLKCVSSVSGGSLAAGVLGMNWHALGVVEGSPSAQFGKWVIDPIRTMASTTVDEGAVVGGILLPGPISSQVSDRYDRILFAGRTLQDLPDTPRFVINTTNVQSGVLMRFSKPYIRDYRVGQILRPTLPLSRAIAASSAFPPILSPCEIKVGDYGMKFEAAADGEDLNRPPYTTDLVLCDGGVYDNLGLETAWKRYDTILVSDGGAHIQPEPAPHRDWARHACRVLDIIDSQVRALRTRQLIELYRRRDRKGAYWGIRENYPAAGKLPCPPARTAGLAAVPTRLKSMDDSVQERLINWGYAICDTNLRTWFNPDLTVTERLPYPVRGV